MNIKNIDDITLLKGVEILKNNWEIPDEYEIYASKGEKLSVKFDSSKMHITYPLKSAFFRALTLISLSLSKGECKDIEETLYFDECGVMLDLSRNGVMTVKSVKEYAEYMALMGLNQIYLYLEDIYEIEGYPFFGYLRGRYTKEELKEIDEYCDLIGVEVIPHIQTLGHMASYLRWDEARDFRDTNEILLAGDETTYDFIKKAIVSISSCFKTKKIHLGMDEAGNLGSGKYYALHGPCDRKEILINHIKRVTDIAEELNLEPIIYGDVLYAVAMGSSHAGKGDIVLPDELKNNLPKNLIPVYWNYYSEDYEEYKSKLESYKELTGKTYFWGGIWTWLGLSYDAVMTEILSDPALKACKDANVRTAIGSAWGDNGCECNFFLSVHGLMYFAEHMYNKEVNNELFKERLEYIVKAPYEAFVEMSYFHNDYDNFNDYPNYMVRYVGKKYYWADIMLGLLDKQISEKPMSSYYKSLYERFLRFVKKDSKWYEEFEFLAEAILTLSKKCYILENLRNAYLKKDRDFMEKCVNELLPELKCAYKKTGELHRGQWFKVLKPYGYEVLDVRYGGMINRVDTTIARVKEYLNGSISNIEEFEAERLEFAGIGFRHFEGLITPNNKV